MKYVAIDIETTGLDPETCQILEVAMLVDDLNNQLPIEQLSKFHFCIKHKVYSGDPIALAMNSNLLEKLGKNDPNDNLIEDFELADKIKDFFELNKLERPTAAGKNIGVFDLQFLKPYLVDVHFRYRHLDIGNLYFDIKSDLVIPDLKECLKRANLEPTGLHTALGDTIDIVKLIRSKYGNPVSNN